MLKIFVRLVRPYLAAFSVLLAACQCFPCYITYFTIATPRMIFDPFSVVTWRATSRDILALQGGDTEQSRLASYIATSRLVMFQIQLVNGLEIAVAMHVMQCIHIADSHYLHACDSI